MLYSNISGLEEKEAAEGAEEGEETEEEEVGEEVGVHKGKIFFFFCQSERKKRITYRFTSTEPHLATLLMIMCRMLLFWKL